MLTEAQKIELDKDIQGMVDARVEKQVEERLSKEIIKRFSPGEVKVTLNPQDALIADKLGGFKSKAHFYNDVIKAGHGEITEDYRKWDMAVKTAGYMEEGDLSQGGYTVAPPEVLAAIMQKNLETAIVKPRARIQPISGNAIEIIADVDKDHTTDYFGGITIYRPGEGGQKTPKNPTYEKIGLKLHKVTGLCHVTDELLEDSTIALGADITRKFGEAIAFVQDDDFLFGTGANMPLGVLNSTNPSIVTVTAETGQGAATIVFENLVKMWARMYPRGHANAIWIANIECFPALATMGLAVGAGGVPVWMPAGGISGTPFNTLFGRELVLSEKMQALGTAGDIALVDLSQYCIIQKGDGNPQVATSIHFKFDYDMTSFRFVLRYDGQPTWTSALIPKRGSGTLSPTVVLASDRT